MGWREKMGLETPTKNPKNPKNPKNRHDEGVPSVFRVDSKGSENEESYPIPATEKEFAKDERSTIIQFDGGPDFILGSTVKGAVYTHAELASLKNSGLLADELPTVHRIKQTFDGAVVPSTK